MSVRLTTALLVLLLAPATGLAQNREHLQLTRIVPPFDQYLPPGANAHVAGFTLAVPDEEQHRRRFPERSHRQPARSPGIYLDAFQSVRWIHEDMLRMAEEAETVVLSNADLDKTLRSAVDILSRGLPLDDGGTGMHARQSARRREPD